MDLPQREILILESTLLQLQVIALVEVYQMILRYQLDKQVPSRLDPTVHDAVPYVEFNEDGTKLLIAQKAIGKWDVRKSKRDRDHRKGYLKIIDRVSTEDTDNKVRISFDIDPTGEKSQYEIKFFNDFQITYENDISLSKGLQDGKFGLSEDGSYSLLFH